MLKPTAILIPFGWEDYPKDMLMAKINESNDCVADLGIELIKAEPELKNEEIQKARNMLKKEEYDFTGRLSVSSYAFAGWKGLLNSTPYLEDQKITLARIASKGDNYKLHYLTGTTKPMGPFREAGCPNFPRAEILPDTDGIEFGKKSVPIIMP